MASDEERGDDDPVPPLLPPDDRVWRHPSEVAGRVPGAAMPPPPAPRLRRRWRPPPAASWAVAGLAAGVALSAVAAAGRPGRTEPAPAVELVVAPGSTGPMTAPPEAIVGIADHLRPVVVGVRSEGAAGATGGSGVVFRSDGHILTNQHLVAGARSVVVVMADGAELEASVVGTDAETDVAVVKVAPPAVSVASAVIGSAAGLRVGQMALVLGASGAGARPTIAVGAVRALARSVEVPGRLALPDMIQTDLPVTTAASGGPLVDASGAVVGITTALAGSNPVEGRVGYATTIDAARDVAVQLIETGRVARSWLGIDGEDLGPAEAAAAGLSGGARVKAVAEGGPAERGGLQPGEVVTSLDGLPVRSLSGLKALLRGHRPGETVTVSVAGPAGPRTVEVELAERPRRS